MKKRVLFFPLLALVLVLSGCGEKDRKQTGDGENSKGQKEESSIISSIGDAMKMGKSMRCTYRVESGGEKVDSVIWVKGDKNRSETTVQGRKMVSVFDGETLYNWNEGEKKGFKMTKKCTDELAQMNQEQKRNENQEMEIHMRGRDEEGFDDALDVKCESVSKIDFSVPDGVEFVDQCEMMKRTSQQSEEMMKRLEKEGLSVPFNAGQ